MACMMGKGKIGGGATRSRVASACLFLVHRLLDIQGEVYRSNSRRQARVVHRHHVHYFQGLLCTRTGPDCVRMALGYGTTVRVQGTERLGNGPTFRDVLAHIVCKSDRCLHCAFSRHSAKGTEHRHRACNLHAGGRLRNVLEKSKLFNQRNVV